VTRAPVRVAVVGLGIGQAHVYGFRRRKDLFAVTALCDTDPEKLAPMAERLGDVRVTTDLDEIVGADDVDVISLCTPPFLHLEQATAALEGGHHVVCEKPLVGSLRDLDQLLATEAAQRSRVVGDDLGPPRLMPVFQYRYGRGLQKLRALVDAGLTGELFTISMEVAWTRGPDYFAVPWRGRLETELGGTLFSHCVHGLDMATYVARPVAGDVARVFARVATRVNDVETDDVVSASAELAGGGYLTLSATLGSAAEISRQRFCFREVTAESNDAAYTSSSDPWTFTARDPARQEAIDAVLAEVDARAEAESYQRQFELFHAAVTGGSALPVTLDDARRSLELVTAMYASAATGTQVQLPLPVEHPFHDGWRS
jgi:predicted dehydrogenase